jgi:hypothetical protein
LFYPGLLTRPAEAKGGAKYRRRSEDAKSTRKSTSYFAIRATGKNEKGVTLGGKNSLSESRFHRKTEELP